MKKDFSQDFEKSVTILYELLVRHNGKILVTHSKQEYEEDFYNVQHVEVLQEKDATMQIVAFLEAKGMSPFNMRELARQTGFAYSFIDKTPGHTNENVCIVVDVDLHDDTQLESDIEEHLFLLPEDAIAKLEASPSYPTLTSIGLTRLISNV